jgi:hypothetical protein
MAAANNGEYIAYLIRLWREGPGVWRGMLVDPRTGERVYFTSLDDLLAFLREQVTEQYLQGDFTGCADHR